MTNTQYHHVYSPSRFWRKIGPRALGIGRSTLAKALYLFYAAQSPSTPKWARRVMYGALGYFIFPLDAIPDLAPLVGYTDDLSVMAAALATVAFYITPEIKQQAHQTLEKWFGKPAGTSVADA
ncbi:YkvA family protein [Allopusillimonas ginsengisoli]|uniref:YkvA family protein n=1 Tax=Allopusillimonas ginsengisoli TaxID=453575 RepID=UPI0039C35BB8